MRHRGRIWKTLFKFVYVLNFSSYSLHGAVNVLNALIIGNCWKMLVQNALALIVGKCRNKTPLYRP